MARIWRWLGQHRSVPVDGVESSAAAVRISESWTSPIFFLVFGLRGSPVHCPLPASDQARHERTRTPKSSRRSGIRLELGMAGYDQWRGAAVGMALATRYLAWSGGGVGSRSRSWRMRQMEVEGQLAMRCDATGPERDGNGCWCQLLGSPLPRMLHLSFNWTLRRRVEKVQARCSSDRGRGGRVGGDTAAQRSEATGEQVVELSGPTGQRAKGASVSLRVMQTLPLPRPPLSEPIPDGQALFPPTSTTPLLRNAGCPLAGGLRIGGSFSVPGLYCFC